MKVYGNVVLVNFRHLVMPTEVKTARLRHLVDATNIFWMFLYSEAEVSIAAVTDDLWLQCNVLFVTSVEV